MKPLSILLFVILSQYSVAQVQWSYDFDLNYLFPISKQNLRNNTKKIHSMDPSNNDEIIPGNGSLADELTFEFSTNLSKAGESEGFVMAIEYHSGNITRTTDSTKNITPFTSIHRYSRNVRIKSKGFNFKIGYKGKKHFKNGNYLSWKINAGIGYPRIKVRTDSKATGSGGGESEYTHVFKSKRGTFLWDFSFSYTVIDFIGFRPMSIGIVYHDRIWNIDNTTKKGDKRYGDSFQWLNGVEEGEKLKFSSIGFKLGFPF